LRRESLDPTLNFSEEFKVSFRKRAGGAQQPQAMAIFSASSMERLNRSVEKRSWHPGQQFPGFLNQLTVFLILIPHLGQVTSITVSSIVSSPWVKSEW
jgi:hypothetical protein